MFSLTENTNNKLVLFKDSIKGKNILITGGTGFIGSYLSYSLSNLGANVTVLTRRKQKQNSAYDCKYHIGDITDKTSLTDCCEGISIIIHMAGSAHVEEKDKDRHLSVSLDGTKNILKEALKTNVTTVIYISSIKSMGVSKTRCLDEEDQENPEDVYGESRLAAEKIILKWGIKNSIKTSVLRLPLVYGPGVKGNIKKLLLRSSTGKSLPLPQVNNNRSMVYVGDVIQAIFCLTFNLKSSSNVYIVTDGLPYSISDLVHAIDNITGNGSKWHVPLLLFKFMAVTGDVVIFLTRLNVPFNSRVYYKLFGDACYSAKKINGELGFTPTATFYSVLKDMLGEEKR